MEVSSPARRVYDHRLKDTIANARNPYLFPELSIPRRTASRWVNGRRRPVVSVQDLDETPVVLVARIRELETRCMGLEALLALVTSVFNLFGLSIDWHRVPAGEVKDKLLEAITRCSTHVPLSRCLAAIGLSATRFYRWRKLAVQCQLDDHPSCPGLTPSKLTAQELAEMRELVTSPAFAHFPIRALSLLAKRTGAVFASATTWYRQIKQHQWLRPRARLYPAKPKVGVRATQPNQIWHVDVTILRLVDGSKAYIQAVVDNFSKYVLAWKVSAEISAVNTKELLLAALAKAKSLGDVSCPEVFSDSGVENVNSEVEELERLLSGHADRGTNRRHLLELRHRVVVPVSQIQPSFPAAIRGTCFGDDARRFLFH